MGQIMIGNDQGTVIIHESVIRHSYLSILPIQIIFISQKKAPCLVWRNIFSSEYISILKLFSHNWLRHITFYGQISILIPQNPLNILITCHMLYTIQTHE
uniref:Putative ovule protein n=1 Tax=Solanum chacoense TaxID=4108 RepID=A0A0V0H1N1_SOLCH